MTENIITSLVSQYNALRRAENWRNQKLSDLTDASIEYSGASKDVDTCRQRITKIKSSIKAVWGEEALEIAMKAVKEAEEKRIKQ